jgi:hypothetical protein
MFLMPQRQEFDVCYGIHRALTDMGTPARAHGVGTHGLYSGKGLCRLWPKIGVEGQRSRIRKLLCKPT